MDTINASKHLVFASAAVVLAVAIGVVWLVGGKKPSQGRAAGATTETAALSAGAKVTPTEPKLRIAPK